MNIRSKLPNLQTTIFSKMSALAAEHQAINLSQGFPNFETDEKLTNLCQFYLKKGYNQYAPMAGLINLCAVLTQKIECLYQQKYNPNTEITITAGATQAIFCAITAFAQWGDEVIIIEPAYDCYEPAIKLTGAKTVSYVLKSAENWRINWSEMANLINEKTAMIIINSPHNPTGSILKKEDLQQLENLVKGKNIVVLSDEVYEHLTFDNEPHESILKYPNLRKQSLAVFSFGKTLHATGWKIGYIVGEENLMREFRKVHQFNVFSVNTPFQHAIADYLQDEKVYLNLSDFMQKKRDCFLNLIKKTQLKPLRSEGTYFQILDYSAISQQKDTDFAIWLTEKIGVATIPISVFYTKKNIPAEQNLIRVCFAKTEETLEKAAFRLEKF
jgi:methionine transaminase